MRRRAPPRAPIDPSTPVHIPRRHWARLVLAILAALFLGGSGSASGSASAPACMLGKNLPQSAPARALRPGPRPGV